VQNKKPATRPKPEMARKWAEAWLAESRQALESSNAFVEAHGLPLARYRNF
jgi:antitoxin CcdA